jgi:magnesium transporter
MPHPAQAPTDHPSAVDHGLRQHAETAGEQLVTRVPRARMDQRVAAVLEDLLGEAHDCVDLVCVVDEQERLRGVVTLVRLLAAPRDTLLAALIENNFPRVLAGTDQERVASLALHHALAAIPVIDDHERLLGVVPSEALLRILRREHVEDLHRLAGITREHQRAREAMVEPPLRRLRHRLPWLLLGLLGSTVATFIVARFEAALAVHPAVVFFIPGLVYLADAIGTQTETVAVRGMSLSHVRLSSLVAGELRTGLLIGLVLGGLTLPAIWLAFGEFQLALVVAASLVAAGGIATTIGLLLPWLLGRLGSDPAYGSGPLATIVQDLLSLLTYFVIVSLVVL